MSYVSYTCCVVHYPSVTGKHGCRVYIPACVCLSFCLSIQLFWRISMFITDSERIWVWNSAARTCRQPCRPVGPSFLSDLLLGGLKSVHAPQCRTGPRTDAYYMLYAYWPKPWLMHWPEYLLNSCNHRYVRKYVVYRAPATGTRSGDIVHRQSLWLAGMAHNIT